MARRKFLIFADKKIFNEDISNIIKKTGHEVVAVSSSVKYSIKKINESEPDAVLIDVAKGKESEVLEIAESIIKSCELPIVLLLESVKKKFLNRAFDIGIYEYLIKPIRESDFSHTIEIILRRSVSISEMKENKDRFWKLAETTNMAIMLYQNNKWIAVNSAACKITGYSREELLGKEFWGIVHPDYRKLVAGRGKKRQLGKDAEPHYELKIITKTGKEKWVLLNGATTKFSGKPAGLISVIDITDQKKAHEELKDKNEDLGEVNEELFAAMEELESINEELVDYQKMLKRSERLYREIFNETPVGIYQTNPEGKFLAANTELTRILGYEKPDELLRLKNISFELYADPERRSEFVNRMKESGEVTDFEAEMKRKNGQKIWISLNARTKRASNGSILYFDGYMRDISKQKYAEEELKRSEEKFRLISEQSLMGIVIIQNGIVKYINNAFTQMTEFSFEELQNLSPYEFMNFVYADDKEYMIQQEKKKKSGINEHYLNYDFRMIKKSGETKWLSMYSRSIKFDDMNADYITLIDISNQKHVEDDLRNSEKRFREFVELLPQIVIEVDLLGTITFVNNKGLEISGYTREDVEKGLKVTDLLKPEDVPRAVENMKKILFHGFSHGSEYAIIKKDGTFAQVMIYSDRIVKDEKPAGFRSVIVDITTRKEAEKSLKESEERFRTLHNASFGGIGIHDKGVILECNQGLSDVSGYSYDELIGMNGLLLISSETRDFVMEKIVSGYEYPYVAEGIRKDGSRYPLEIQGKKIPFHGADVRVTEFRDITARMKTEEELRKRETQLMHIAKNFPGAIYQFYARPGNDYGLYYISDRTFEILGIGNTAEGFFENFIQHLDPDFQEGFMVSIAEAVRDFKKWEYEGKFIRPDGTVMWFKGISTPVRYETELVFNGVLLDVTEQKNADEDRGRLTSQLRQAQKMEAIGRLAGGVAHDFNNMLTAIIGNADLALLSIDEGGNITENLKDITATAERAAELTRQLLAFSRKQIIKPTSINLNEILITMERMLKRIISEDIVLSFIKESDLGYIKADPSQIEQLVVNLVVNARDAMSKGGDIIIRTSNVELGDEFLQQNPGSREGLYIELQVTDSGVGISEGVKEQIFEPFFTTKGEMGTGLGLATVYGVIKQNNGYITVESKEGEGTTFSVYFPRVLHMEDVDFLKEKIRYESEDKVFDETILVVEDEDSVRNLAVKSLEYYGYTVISASGGESALELCAGFNGSIDLLLSDAIMPGMSGPELAPKIQELFPDVKVLFMSGYTEDAIVDEGILKPEVNFISKPFGPFDLARKVREVLEEVG